MTRISPVKLLESTCGSIESWTLETLHDRYHFEVMTKQIVERALMDRDALLRLMESRGYTDPKILEMCDYLMDIRNQFVRMILDDADRKERTADYLRQQASNI